MPLTHLKRILVNVEDVKMGVRREDSDWWNWGVYLKTWEMIDENPDTPLQQLPLWPVMEYHFKRKRRSKKALQWQVGHVVGLYKEIKKNGFDQEKEKRIRVKIKNNGVVECTDGHHRISMLRHFGSPKKILVDVRLGLDDQPPLERHPKWIELKEKAYTLYKKKLLYQPLEHPDFADWKIDRECVDRWKVIKKYLGNVVGKKFYDIGSCTGYFCWQLARAGARVIGVEKDETRVEIAKFMSKYHGFPNNNPRFLVGRFEDHIKGQFDAVLFLSLFHHYIRSYEEEAWKTTNLISKHSKMMFMDLSLNRLPLKWSPQKVLKTSRFTTVEQLSDVGRPLYVFSR